MSHLTNILKVARVTLASFDYVSFVQVWSHLKLVMQFLTGNGDHV